MSKGQASYPFSIMESVVTALLLLGVIYGTQSFTSDFIKEQSAGIEAERVANAALSLSSVPEGHIEVEMSGYSVKEESNTIYVKYRDTEETAEINTDLINYQSVNGPSSYTEVEGYLCLKKEIESDEPHLDITEGAC